MSIIKSEDGKKWINSFIAIVSILAGYITISFMESMGELFDLEAKVKYYLMVSQGIGILVGLVTFITILKNKNASTHMNEVYAELVKVVCLIKTLLSRLRLESSLEFLLLVAFLSVLTLDFKKSWNSFTKKVTTHE